MTLLYNKFKSMLVLFIKNNRVTSSNICEMLNLSSCLVLPNKIIKGTKWEFIMRTVFKNKKGLLGIDKFEPSCLGSEWASHVFEMKRVQLLNNGHVYIPIPDNIIPKFRKGYTGKLHDGLVFDTSSGSIAERIEFKSKINGYFHPLELNKLLDDYSPLGVDRLDLCCLNSQGFEETVLNVNQLDHNSFPLKFNPVDFSTIFTEFNNDSYSNMIKEIISNQIALNPDIIAIWPDLISDPSLFPVT